VKLSNPTSCGPLNVDGLLGMGDGLLANWRLGVVAEEVPPGVAVETEGVASTSVLNAR
jgi:hypothetical protein